MLFIDKYKCTILNFLALSNNKLKIMSSTGTSMPQSPQPGALITQPPTIPTPITIFHRQYPPHYRVFASPRQKP